MKMKEKAESYRNEMVSANNGNGVKYQRNE
jgi:hypothetical protein